MPFEMLDDSFPAAEKILTDIDAVFKKDKKLKDFEILPVPICENKSPVIHAEHSLGLEKWCVRHLYMYVYHKIVALKQQQRLRREDPLSVSRLLLGGVLLNPDSALLWNIRRDFVVTGRFDFTTELQVAAVSLSRRPKCSEAFIYRRWILSQILAKSTQHDPAFFSNLLAEEMQVAQMAADRYANNYHAWNHRMWTVLNISPLVPNVAAVLVNEWSVSEAWVSCHVSEHSGLQYRQFLFKQLSKHLNHSKICCQLHHACLKFFPSLQNLESYNNYSSKSASHENSVSKSLTLHVFQVLENNKSSSMCPILCAKSDHMLLTALLAYEFMLVTELINLYPGHEALWSHRRFITFSFCTLAKEISPQVLKLPEMHDGVPVPKAQKLSLSETKFEDEFLWKVILWHEDKFFLACTAEVEEDCFQKKLALQHRKWFQQVLLPRLQPQSSRSADFS